jgi:ABC-type sugar transport system substrate-binding protein
LKTLVARFVTPSWIWVAISGMACALVAPGCDSTSFVPPPPPELSDPAQSDGAPDSVSAELPPLSPADSGSASNAGRVGGGRRVAGGPKIIELVLAKPPNRERVYLTQSLRRDAGKAKMLLRVTNPERGQPPSPERMAAAIRAAIERGSMALIVEPMDDPTVLELLYKAQAHGTPVLLLDRPIPPRAGKSIPCIRYEPFEKLGRQIVQAVLETARLTRRPGDGRILVVQNRSTDPYSAERLASLTDALKAAGQSYETLSFEGDASAAAAIVQAALAAPTKVAIVLAEEDEGLNGARRNLARPGDNSQPDKFVLGGYGSYDLMQSDYAIAKCAAYGDRAVGEFAVTAFKTVRSLIEGKPVGDRIETPMSFHRSNTSDVPQTQSSEAPPTAKSAGS